MSQIEVAIIGAGMAGLMSARILQQAGYQVVVVEKSRGVGGRMATRRLHGAIADHGTCYLSPKSEQFHQFLQTLVSQDVLQVWTDAIHTLDARGQVHPPGASDRAPRYIAPAGMTAIAKALAGGLDIRFNQRASQLTLQPNPHWQITLEDASTLAQSTLEAKAVIITAPAPQAVALLQPLAGQVFSEAALKQLQAIEFTPCISVMAGYPLERAADWNNQYPNVTAIAASDHPSLAWIGLDSSKRLSSSQVVLVIQSAADFAVKFLDATDLMPAAQGLLQQAAVVASWVESPEWMQAHRWRYAFAKQPLSSPYWTAETPAPLLCSGDWCGGRRVESAFYSALEAVEQLNRQLQNRDITPRLAI